MKSDCVEELAQFASECTAFSIKLSWNWPKEGIFGNELLNDRDRVAYIAVLAILAFIARFIKLTLDLKNGTFLKQVIFNPSAPRNHTIAVRNIKIRPKPDVMS